MARIPRVAVFVETSRAFGRNFIRGITKYSRIHGPWIFYTEPRDLNISGTAIKNIEVDGIIMRNTPLTYTLIKKRIPVISVLHYPLKKKIMPVVKTDCKKISEAAFEHFVGLGYLHFGFCGFSDYEWSNERLLHFTEIAERNKYKVNTYSSYYSNEYSNWKKDQKKIAAWLKSLPKPIGIMACNDDRGHHVLEACKLANLRVPEDVAVIGVDNDELVCEMSDPPLSSIALNTESAGYETAEILDKLMQNKKNITGEILVNPTHIVARKSTDIFAVNDHEVIKALKFIYANISSKLNVNNIVQVTNLSRRSLECRFKKYLGRSIMEEVRRRRTELLTKYLVETELSISEICRSINYTDISHISRYFKKEKGIGLKDFRTSSKK